MEYLTDLNSAQREAVIHAGAPLLIVAGAGTGKTTVVTRRIARLITEEKTKPEEVLAVTFTEKAAGEMEERVDRLLPYGYQELHIGTFHSFCEHVLRDYGLEIGLPVPFEVLTPTDAWILVRENLTRFDLDYYRPLGNPSRFLHALIAHFARAKDEGITPEEYLAHAQTLQLNADSENLHMGEVDAKRMAEIAAAYHTYNQLLLEKNLLDFGDLITYTIKLFRERPHILLQFQDRFKHVLIDEFQDTNLTQYELVKLLTLGGKDLPCLTVVGDDNQSIYKFRGASISNILKFKEDFKDAREILLTENYRSKTEILDAAYRLIQHNNPYTLETQLGISKNLRAVQGGSGTIELIHAKDEREEAVRAVGRIAELAECDPTVGWNDFGILVRARAHAEYIVNTLEDAHIPFHFIGATGLLSEPEAMDVHAYLRILADPHDSIAAYRILNLEIFKLADEELARLTSEAHKGAKSLLTVARGARMAGFPVESVQKLEKIIASVERHTALARTAPVTKVVLAFLHDSGYLQTLIDRERAGEARAAKGLVVLRRLCESIERFEARSPEKTLRAYLAHLDFMLASGDEGGNAAFEEEGPEAVKVMTIHAAKGLEFKYVIVPHLVEQRFPTNERRDTIELPRELINEILPDGDWHLMEERRLFYVALTRARDGLILTWADTYGQGTRVRKKSRFLHELDIEPPQTFAEGPDVLHREERPNVQTRETRAAHRLAPTQFSFTQLKAYETCPLQYKFAHVLRIPIRGRATFSFGKTMHLTLQRFYTRMIEMNRVAQGNLFSASAEREGVQCPSLEDLLKIYEEVWIDDWFEDAAQKESYCERGKKMLKAFYEKQASQGWGRPLLVEAPFHLKVGSYTIKGAIDRIDAHQQGVAIIDYKTGAPKEAEELTFEDKQQLLIYQRAVSGVHNVRPAILTFYYLQNNTEVSFLGTDAELKKVEKKIVDTIQKISGGDFTPTPSPFVCRTCDFRTICPFRQLS